MLHNINEIPASNIKALYANIDRRTREDLASFDAIATDEAKKGLREAGADWRTFMYRYLANNQARTNQKAGLARIEPAHRGDDVRKAVGLRCRAFNVLKQAAASLNYQKEISGELDAATHAKLTHRLQVVEGCFRRRRFASEWNMHGTRDQITAEKILDSLTQADGYSCGWEAQLCHRWGA